MDLKMLKGWLNGVGSDALVGGAFLGVVVLLMVPVPPVLLDLLLAFSLAVAAVVFLTALFSERPIDFSVFPTLLLVSTLMRLSLNIASTRLILLNGHEGSDAAGRVILAFSDFVVGGNLGVGLIIFLALVLINFVVITKGAGRIAEVAARFTLDALPGKQMAIDAELNAGAISDSQAKKRRDEVEQAADFYGAMDGASKFVRGDAIAGLIITGINLVGGVAIGIVQQDLSFSEAVTSYSMLSVGDGLVSQMPALVVSTAAGLVISRASGRAEIGAQLMSQLFGGKNVLGLAAVFMIVIGMVPGLPMFPFALLAAILWYVPYRRKKQEAALAIQKETKVEKEPPAEPTMGEVLHLEPLSLEVGYGLLTLVDAARGGDLPERVKKLRKQLAQELGIVVPSVRVLDNLQLKPEEYVIRVEGVEAARVTLVAGRMLAIDAAGTGLWDRGTPATDPVFGLKGFWIEKSDKNAAEGAGLTVVDPSTVLATHLAEVLRKNATHFLTRDQVNELVGYVQERQPKLVEELIPQQLSLGELLAVLKELLREQVSIRNLGTVLEAIAQQIPRTKDPRMLAEAARAALWRQITSTVADDEGRVHAICIDGGLEQALRNSRTPEGELAPDVEVAQGLLSSASDVARRVSDTRQTPCILAPNDLRRGLRELLEVALADVPVVAARELDKRAELMVVGTIQV